MASSFAAGADPCATVVTLTPGERVAEISAVASDAVQFRGNLTVTPAVGLPGQAWLTAVVSNGLVAVLSPASIAFELVTPNNLSFNVTVVVPAATAATNIGQVTVTARSSLGGEQCQPGYAQAVVTPMAYFGTWRVAFDVESVVIEVGQSRDVNGTLSIKTNIDRPMKVGLRFESAPGITVPDLLPVDLDWFQDGTLQGDFTVTIEAASPAPGEYALLVFVRGAVPFDGSQTATFVEQDDPFRLVVPQQILGLQMAVLASAIGALGAAAAAVYWRRLRA